MPWNKRFTGDWRLYVILDAAVLRGRDVADAARAAIEGGADILQYRDKLSPVRDMLAQAARLAPVCADGGVPLIINDRLDVALGAGATGVHLGQDDMPLPQARALAGASLWIGQSTHAVAQFELAASEGATYIAVGPVFPTPTKPEYGSVGFSLVRAAAQRLRVPWLAIGGIDVSNIDEVLDAGATRVAVVRAVAGADDIRAAARELKQRLLDKPVAS